jgi:hypothetical protein
LPRQTRWIFLAQYGNVPVIDFEPPFSDLHFSREMTIGRIVPEEMRVGMQVGHVVDGDDGQVLFVTLQDSAETQAPNPAKPIDGYVRGHLCSSPMSAKGNLRGFEYSVVGLMMKQSSFRVDAT